MELFKFYSVSDNDVIIHTVANIIMGTFSMIKTETPLNYS